MTNSILIRKKDVLFAIGDLFFTIFCMKRVMRSSVWAVIFCLVFVEIHAETQDYPYKFDAIYDGVLLGSGVLVAGGILLWKNNKDIVTGYEKIQQDGPLDINNVNAFDRYFYVPYNHNVDIASEVFLYSSMVLAASAPWFQPQSDWEDKLYTTALFGETALWLFNVQFILKYSVLRYRPFVYNTNPPGKKIDTNNSAESFPSGHSIYSFGAATFFHQTYQQIFEGGAQWPIYVGYSLAATTALLRVGAGVHFVSDTLVGAVLGGAVGWLIPWSNQYFNDKKSKAGANAVSLSLHPSMSDDTIGAQLKVVY